MIQKDLFHVYGAARIVKSTVFTNTGGKKKNALKPLEYEGGSMCVCVCSHRTETLNNYHTTILFLSFV